MRVDALQKCGLVARRERIHGVAQRFPRKTSLPNLAQRRWPETMSLDGSPEPRPCFGRIVDVIDIARDVAGVDRPKVAAVFRAIPVVA